MRALSMLALAACLGLASPALAQEGEEYLDDSVGEEGVGEGYDEEAVGEAEGEAPFHAEEAEVAPAVHGEHAVEGEHGAAEGEHGEGEHADGEHGAAGAHDAHGEHGAATFADIDPVAFGGSLVNFGLLLVVLWLLLRKTLPEFLSNRRASVVEGMEEAKRVKADADAKYKEYSERIDNLDAELERLREEMRRAGMDERDRIVAEASKRAEKMRDEARFLIEQQMKQLRVDLTREAIEAAIAAAEAVLTKSTGAQDQERLAKDYLATIRATVKKKSEEKSL